MDLSMYMYMLILSFSNVMTIYNCNCLHVGVICYYHLTDFRFSTPSSYCLRDLPGGSAREIALERAVFRRYRA